MIILICNSHYISNPYLVAKLVEVSIFDFFCDPPIHNSCQILIYLMTGYIFNLILIHINNHREVVRDGMGGGGLGVVIFMWFRVLLH